MRIRSAATVLVMLGLLAGAIVRCALPPLPPPPEALPSGVGFVHGAIVALPPGGAVDHAALIASLKELKLNRVILETSASQAGESVNDRVALAIELQRELDADVFIGTYQSNLVGSAPIETLLQQDPAFVSCYPGGTRLDTEAPLIDKLRICSQDVSKKIADALKAANASPRIGCYITQQTDLVDTLTDQGRAKLGEYFRGSAGPCAEAGRFIAISQMLSPRSGDPDRAGVLVRDSLQDSGVAVVMLQDGVGTLDPAHPRRAAQYYSGLRSALVDRTPTMLVWARVEAFDCEPPSCARTHPTKTDRFTQQLCGARSRADDIVVVEYIHDFAGSHLVTPLLQPAGDAGDGGTDGSSEVQAILDDVDAAAQLRRGYLEWRDSGASCAQ